MPNLEIFIVILLIRKISNLVDDPPKIAGRYTLAICSKGQRRFHKLAEWSKAFIDWARELPYAQELIFIDEYERKKEEKENE